MKNLPLPLQKRLLTLPLKPEVLDQISFISLKTKLLSTPLAWVEELNGTDLGLLEIKQWFFNLNMPPNPAVYVLWMAYNSGIELEWHTFIETYDQLWFPAVDDVYVVDQKLKWCLLLDHEEFFHFAKLSITSADAK